MTTDDSRVDSSMRELSVLTVHAPDPARAARIAARCHAVMARRRRLAGPGSAPARATWRRSLEPALVGVPCGVFLFEVLARALRLYGF
jgi:hypothetical protein